MTDSNWTPKERDESFGVVVFRKNNKEVLLVKTNYWGFPKGHREDGEDGITAAVREVKEETGISTKIADPEKSMFEEYEIRREQYTTKKMVTYWTGFGEGDPRPKEGEILEARWVSFEEAVELLTHESARSILRDATSLYPQELL